MAMPRLAHVDDEVRRAYSAEMRSRTLRVGRVVAGISIVGIVLFLLQDEYVEVAEQTLILASAVFSGCLLPCQGQAMKKSQR